MKQIQFEMAASIDPRWGRCTSMCSHRDDIFAAFEFGQLVRISHNFVSTNLYLQELHFPAAPMPNPI